MLSSYLIWLLGAAYSVYRLALAIYNERYSPLRDLPGPPNPSRIYGHLWQIINAAHSTMQEKWVREYGTTLKTKGLFNTNRLLTVDLKALDHVLKRSDIYEKPELVKHVLSRMVGGGILLTEGAEHKRQRRVMNPAFNPGRIRGLTGVIFSKATQLRDIWLHRIQNSNEGISSAPATKVVTLDALHWLSRVSLDIIGLAGFGHDFNSLTAEGKTSDELGVALEATFSAGPIAIVLAIVGPWIPLLRLWPSKTERKISFARNELQRIGKQLIHERKFQAEGKQPQGQDLLSVLVQANSAADLPQSQRMSEQEVVDQIPAFLVAGHESSSTAAAWILYALALAPNVQSRLRSEILEAPIPRCPGDDDVHTGSLSEKVFDTLNHLPFLDAVVRETLRLHAPIPSTMRVAVQDDVIPLDTPYIGLDGREHDIICVKKGDPIFIPTLMVNRSKDIWGEDAHEFKPERWLTPPEEATRIPGPWANLLTFLAGPHACIGYRFALAELKILVHVLVTSFTFELAVEPSNLVKRSLLVTRPSVTSGPWKGDCLPLRVRPVDNERSGGS